MQRFQKLIFCFSFGLILFASNASAASPPERSSQFACGGELEANIWRRWDTDGKRLLESLVVDRLLKQGDTYALYDFEIYFHNLLSMAQRCNRVDRHAEFAAWISKTYAQLSVAQGKKYSLEWVCRGGTICNEKNRLVNKEVMLTSVQFLALATSVANGLSRDGSVADNKAFAAETARIAFLHLQRWDNPSARRSLQMRIVAKASDVKDGSSALFFSDKDVWQIVMYAELAGVLTRYPDLQKELLPKEAAAALGDHLQLLLELFKARTSLRRSKESGGREIQVADLDRGFSRLYADNRYAGYTDKNPPVRCVTKPAESSEKKIQILVEAQSLKPADTLGWDISHARRLVHLFDAIERNRGAMQSFYKIRQEILPDEAIMTAFARQFRASVWNQDKKYPLFANYYGGANGWYRVAYDNGANSCTEGIPPFGLSSAFPTGGYATWSRWDETLGELGRQFFFLTFSSNETDIRFVQTAYPAFSNRASNDVRTRSELAFWPTLIK
ncbi:hypothetical protein J2W25_005711 [Variovorax boronicumulans]|uniref:Uncharacterized protein n=1 Tax=Variovorax boronicumulans TaxID=436515 RepID=A0AAW8E4C7_9BURK|nr:hypothetical protein [Variovorax boronicumulans]MDP9881375.1 hypothetical protein [Variovorax boronicumulans]MDP9926662.1 hypothetical protein [Variovorax boronicumulans]